MAWSPPDHWVEVQGQLRKTGSVKLDASGNGVLTFDPDSARQRWLVTSVVVTTNQAATTTVVPTATIARNTVALSTMSQGNQHGATWSGNQDEWQGEIEISSGDFLAVLFAPPTGQSGTPLSGVIASAIVTGTKYTRRQ